MTDDNEVQELTFRYKLLVLFLLVLTTLAVWAATYLPSYGSTSKEQEEWLKVWSAVNTVVNSG